MELYPHIKPHLSEVEGLMEAGLGAQDKRVYGMLAPFIRRGGKRIRPVLCLLSCGASGGSYADAVRPASIIEMFHNFTLIHDDIEDGAQFRRGEPALHVSHGVAVALNSGDALYTLLWGQLVTLDMSASRLVKLQKLYAAAFKRVVDGQGIEISWIKDGRFDVSEKEYIDMINGKTSALMGLSCESGSFMANSRAPLRRALREYGELIGTAFQIQDDVLNLTGEFSKYQKEIGGDISEGKRTLMVVHCLSHAPGPDRERLASILSSHTRDERQIREAISIMGRSGSVEYARQMAISLIAAARKRVSRLPDSTDKQALLSIADYVVRREK
ncbi:MAG: polyprenyl synthetase family protein [Candidatus Micrarchaeota archaeon]